jgi:hypothetical protein
MPPGVPGDAGSEGTMSGRIQIAMVAAVVLVFAVSSFYAPVAIGTVTLSDSLSALTLEPRSSSGSPSASTDPPPFAFVSNFDDKKLDGWSSLEGAAPTVAAQPNYSGEPTLKSSASAGDQIDDASTGVVAGESFVSIQVAIDAGSAGKGYFGLANGTNGFVAVVGVRADEVVAGANLTDLKSVESLPSGTAQPAGWVKIVANIAISGATSKMQVFVDSTLAAARSISVPSAGSYAELQIETVHSNVHYTDIFATTYQIATVIPGYNNMEGYGQGSGLKVQNLPEFTNYTATMTLNSWSVPQAGILSFQINAMNKTGADKSTCRGFFQLGLSLDKNGKISPWYVPGVNCESTNFASGYSTPAGSVLVLSIIWESAIDKILFRIVDTTTNVTWEKSIAYNYGGFYAAYTQMEFQPCCNSSPISDYALSGELSNMEITKMNGHVEFLPASYMLPFMLDAPPSWNLGYYQNAAAGYDETST